MHYLDHGATAFPKAPGVGEWMRDYVENIGVNVNRGAYAPATEAARMLLSLREALCDMFGLTNPAGAILTPGLTFGLNLALKGLLRPGDHCIVSSVEHNAIMRPLAQLAKTGVAYDCIPAFPDGRMDLMALPRLFRPNTRLVAVCHASNVSGALHPVAEIGRFCRERGVFFVMDAAQSAGHVPIQMGELGVSALALPGHKGLLGPQGIGALLVTEEFGVALTPLVSGGTGSLSDSFESPPFLPDRLEPGTPNLPGAAGLLAALDFIKRTGVAVLGEMQMALTAAFLDGIRALSGARLVGPPGLMQRVGVVSLHFPGRDNSEIAFRLEQEYGVCTRSGLHCAQSAHKALGTFPEGTVRFSFGYGNTFKDVEAALRGIRGLAQR